MKILDQFKTEFFTTVFTASFIPQKASFIDKILISLPYKKEQSSS